MPITMINGKHVLFVHIPKTGGSSVERYLSEHGPLLLKGNATRSGLKCSSQHLHADALSSLNADKGHSWIFTIVRHPVARLVSEYRYQMRKPRWLRKHMSFTTWLSYALIRRAIDPWYRDNHFRPQHEFILPGMEIMRFEDGVDVCLNRIAEKLGTPSPSSVIHEKTSSALPVTLTMSTLDTIWRSYSRDFSDFGYSYDAASLRESGITSDMLDRGSH